MTSQKSFFNIKLFKENLKQQKYLMILHTLVLFIVTTLPALVMYNNCMIDENNLNEFVANDIAYYLAGYNPFMIMLLVAASVATAIFVFNYLYKHQSVQFYHSMPYKRNCLYVTKLLSGITALILPLILAFAVNSVLYNMFGLAAHGCEVSMMKAFFVVTLIYISVFAVASFAATLSGNFFAQLIITAFVFFVYVVTTVAIIISFEAWFDVISIRFFYGSALIFPPILLVEYEHITLWQCLTVIAYTIVFAVAGYFCFKFRKSESTGKFFCYDAIGTFLKYYVAFVASLMFGAIFIEIGRGNIVLSYLGYILAAFIAFIICQGVFGKSFRGMFVNMKAFALFAAIICVVVTVPIAKADYFDNKLPNINGIDDISLNIYANDYHNNYTFKNEQNIKSVLKMLENRDDSIDINENYINAYMTVNPNSCLFSINYNFDTVLQEDYDKWFAEIYDTEEYETYILNAFDFGNGNPYIEIRKHHTAMLARDNADDILRAEQFKDVFVKDFSTKNYNDIKDSGVYAMANIGGVDLKIYDCYENCKAFLKQSGINDLIYESADYIYKIKVFSNTYINGDYPMVFETTDKATIEDVLIHSTEYGNSVRIEVEPSESGSYSIYANIENLPAYVKNAIANN